MSKTKPKSHAPMSAADACMAMHTALRKLADSPTSSNAYQVISMVSELTITPRALHPWLFFGGLVAAEVRKDGKVLRRIALDLDETHWHACESWAKARLSRDKRDVRGASHQALWGLLCAFRLLTEIDWEAMSGFLEET